MYRIPRHPAPMVLELVRHLRISEALKLLLRNTFSLDHFYLLARPLAALPAMPPVMLGSGKMRIMTEEDLNGLYGQIAALGYDDKRDLLSRILFFNMGFKNCYIVKENGTVAHLQWMVLPSENERLKRVYRSRFLPLQEHQVMIENAFTFPACRGRGFFPYVTMQMLKRAQEQGFTQAVTYARKDSVKVLSHLAQLGFKMIRLAPEYKFLGRTWRTW